jgi:hypothetical protein
MTPSIESAGRTIVAPYSSVITCIGPSRSLHQGGPMWDSWDSAIKARHCRNHVPIDHQPVLDLTDSNHEQISSAFWCGPVVNHYGHQLADFGSRLPVYLDHISPSRPLLFGLPATSARKHLPLFFRQILHWFGVHSGSIVFCQEPLVVEDLLWTPQQEQLTDVGPSSEYVKLLTRYAAKNLHYPINKQRLYVSRAGMNAGVFAGESYLELFFSSLGFFVIRPESLSLREQLSLYQNASMIIFSEGSAVHTLQLLGTLEASVFVIARRPGRKLAKNILSSRICSLDYIESIAAFVPGGNRDSASLQNLGISFLDVSKFLSILADHGMNAQIWDHHEYHHAVLASFDRWLKFILSRGYDPQCLPLDKLNELGINVDKSLVRLN